ncbi:MAG TPA: GTP-binding protein [Oligoflexus sp.]|uniref:GTP-binding protein n=1 Tax=Oligoflexus sp. TaxID=1971216 RepID=UPI002D7EE64A|nr:GTP-binding protein [Oligoflexus sp.]HET9238037.1 GTP-binding protein [Oligoflexus sp.]
MPYLLFYGMMQAVLVKGFNMIELPPRRAAPVPLHIVGGLLGSGKTTFIQHQLDHEWAGEKLGLILCEEGAVKLDFSRSEEPRIKRLLNACVCCEMAYSFFEVLVELLRDTAVKRIVVEITAQADVQQIFDFIRSSHLRDYLVYEPIHVLVDARNPHMRFDAPAPMIRRLMDQAEVFVLSFHDQAGARRFNPGAKTVRLSPSL